MLHGCTANETTLWLMTTWPDLGNRVHVRVYYYRMV